MPSMIPAVRVYNSWTPSITFPLKFFEKCFFFLLVFVVLLSFLTKLKFFILGLFMPRILCKPFVTLLTLINLLAVDCGKVRVSSTRVKNAIGASLSQTCQSFRGGSAFDWPHKFNRLVLGFVSRLIVVLRTTATGSSPHGLMMMRMFRQCCLITLNPYVVLSFWHSTSF